MSDTEDEDVIVEVEISHPVCGFLTLLMPWSEIKPLTIRWPIKMPDAR